MNPDKCLFKKFIPETSSLRTLKIMPRNSTKLYIHEFGFWSQTLASYYCIKILEFTHKQKTLSSCLADNILCNELQLSKHPSGPVLWSSYFSLRCRTNGTGSQIYIIHKSFRDSQRLYQGLHFSSIDISIFNITNIKKDTFKNTTVYSGEGHGDQIFTL